MKFLLLTLVMIIFSACAHYDGYNHSAFWAGQAAADSANAAANAAVHIHHHAPAGMP